LYTVLNFPLFQVQAPVIEGIKRLTEQEINSVISVSGSTIFEVIPSRLEEDLAEAFPEFREISVSAGLPARVRVQVVERQPVLAWEQDGFTVWVDESGAAFPPRGELALDLRVLAQNYSGNPQTEANGKEGFLDPELIQAIQQVGAQAPAGVQILYDPTHGLGWVDPKGWQVFIGRTGDNIEAKLQVYKAVAQKLQQDQITPSMISVAQVDAPFYRLDQ
jgi:cell division septal protein FtsQ